MQNIRLLKWALASLNTIHRKALQYTAASTENSLIPFSRWPHFYQLVKL
jgi:hypothetical protein